MECHFLVLTVLKGIENLDFWGCFFQLTKLKFLTCADRKKTAFNICVTPNFKEIISNFKIIG